MKPVFKHDCSNCQFVGNYFGEDVYICGKPVDGTTILARHSDEPAEYSSMRIHLFKHLLTENHQVDMGDGELMMYRDYIMSKKGPPSCKAWLIALTLKGIDHELGI